MNTFHKIISLVFQPLIMPTIGMMLILRMDLLVALPFQWHLMAILGTFLLTCVLPATLILIMIKRGEVSDLFISNREERTMPYLISFTSMVLWTFFLWYTLRLPLFLVSLGIGTSISILLITIINLKWKISAHMIGIGGLTGGLFGISYKTYDNPLMLFVIALIIATLVAISRIALKAHTPGQTLAGFTLAFFSLFFSIIFF